MKTKQHGKPLRRRPKAGWRVVGITDMERSDPLGLRRVRCKVCHQSLRHVYFVEHPDWPKQLMVGKTCSRHMTRC